ncbi:hypothetical protein [Hyalangium gracile]|uniref:hypothetical protein n=1 Tax=Hyalangium gracile TaxID=394092 RepID=UPI001CCFC88F|nr:hypothetical protein [Hyalangium gracile]
MPSIFDLTNGSADPGVQAADDRTLRLAAHPLTEQELTSLIRYQDAFLAIAEASPGTEVLARAHSEAMKAAGLEDSKFVEQGSALLRAFCGQRWAVSKLRDKLKQIESRGPEADELRGRIRDELVRLERTDTFARRYGEEPIALLMKHEQKLLELHTRMTRALSRG